MARMPGATWMPIPGNHNTGGMSTIYGVTLHIMAGTLTGTDAHFRNPAAEASSHFGTGRSGQLRQWVDTKDKAWAQAAGNPNWISIENEGQGGDELTDEQLQRCAEVLVWAHQHHSVPLQVATSPSGRGLGHHGMGGTAWGNHPSCPGPRIVAQKRDVVARAQRLLAGAPGDDGPPAWPGRLLMYVKGRPMMSGLDVRTWQAVLNKQISAGIDVDGYFGSKTAAATRLLQSRKHLAVDGIVGPVTWRAGW